MQRKKGISLIVLVITIIVMIILAVAIIISISSSGIVNRTNEAVRASDEAQMKELVTLAWSEAYLKETSEIKNDAYYLQEVKNFLLENGVSEEKLNRYILEVTTQGAKIQIKAYIAPTINVSSELSSNSEHPTIVEDANFTVFGTVSDDRRVQTLQIGDTGVIINSDGTWSTTVTLDQNKIKEIKIVATDDEGNVSTQYGYVMLIEYVDFTVTKENRAKIGYTEDTTELLIPATFYDEEAGVWYRVVALESKWSVSEAVFGECTNLTNVIFPETLTSIGSYAFANCTNLENVTLPNSITNIGQYAFYNCSSLSDIAIPLNIIKISDSAFRKTAIEKLILPDNITSIEYAAFMDCKLLSSVDFGNGLVSIGGASFFGCTSLTSVIIPDGVETLGANAFLNCTSLESLILGTGLITIGGQAFQGCTALKTVTIPDSVTSLGGQSFGWCTALESVVIGPKVSAMGSYDFKGCTALTNVTFSSAANVIGYGAFYDCTALAKITFKGTTSQWQAISKGTYWNKNTGTYTICCTNGNLSK